LYYTTDGEAKIETIADVRISSENSWNTPCFQIYDGTVWHSVSLDRLAGAKPKNNLPAALRNAIQSQIDDFRNSSPKPELCPLTGKQIGLLAEIDHVIFFTELVRSWGVSPTISYNTTKQMYELDEPYLTSWRIYHKEHAQLRWTSMAGNRNR
jgi:hypothetical protein